MAAAVFLAPLAVGTVHRPALVTLFVVVGAALIALFLGQLRAGDRMRVGASAILPAVFVVICVLQLVPLPASIRNAIDPAGGIRDTEGVLELAYAAEIAPWWVAIASLQRIRHPSGFSNRPDATVIGLSNRVAF